MFFWYFGKGIFRTLACLELKAYSEPWYVQNPRIFRTRNIFRALVHSELEVYSKPWYIQNRGIFRTLSNIYDGIFAKIARKIKKSSYIFLYLGKMELSNSNIKKRLKFYQKKTVLVFQETETPKKFLVFHGTDLSYFSGNKNPKKLLIQ